MASSQSDVSMTMRDVVIVGAGMIGKKRAANLPTSMKLRGFLDIELEKAKEIASEFSVHHFKDLDEVFACLKPGSLVVIATIHRDLAPIASACLSARMHVLIEKPGSISYQEMHSLTVLAEQKNVTVSIGYNHRFHGAALKLKEITDSKFYGPIQLIRARYGHGGRIGYEKEWRANKELSGGGELLDQGCHLIDLIQFYVGAPELEFAMLPTLYWDMQVEDNAFLAGTIGPSTKYWIHASWTEWKNLFSFEVFFKTAKVEWTGLNGSYGPEKVTIHHMENGLGLPNAQEFSFASSDESWKLEFIEVEKRINNQPSLSSSGVEGLKTLEIITKAYTS